MYGSLTFYQTEQFKGAFYQKQSYITSLYWFNAETNEYLFFGESSICDNTSSYPCSLGYYHVDDASNPKKPNRTPDIIATGSLP